MFLGGAAGAVVVVVAVVVIALAASGGEGIASTLQAAGCTVQNPPPQGRQHVLELKKSFKYNSFPPTSGPHHPSPAIWNVYDQPVPEIHLVHNLEHGGVIVQYGDKVPESTVQQIVSWYGEDPNGMIVAPLPALGSKIALTAWTHLATCSNGFNEGAFTKFRDAYRYKGPEPFPPSALAPGT